MTLNVEKVLSLHLQKLEIKPLERSVNEKKKRRNINNASIQMTMHLVGATGSLFRALLICDFSMFRSQSICRVCPLTNGKKTFITNWNHSLSNTMGPWIAKAWNIALGHFNMSIKSRGENGGDVKKHVPSLGVTKIRQLNKESSRSSSNKWKKLSTEIIYIILQSAVRLF